MNDKPDGPQDEKPIEQPPEKDTPAPILLSGVNPAPTLLSGVNPESGRLKPDTHAPGIHYVGLSSANVFSTAGSVVTAAMFHPLSTTIIGSLNAADESRKEPPTVGDVTGVEAVTSPVVQGKWFNVVLLIVATITVGAFFGYLGLTVKDELLPHQVSAHEWLAEIAKMGFIASLSLVSGKSIN